MFERTPVQSPGWRFFAIGLIVVITPLLLMGHSRIDPFKLAFVLITLVGFSGYAFGFRIGPRPFWALFAVLFPGALLWKLSRSAAPALSNLPNPPPAGSTSLGTLAFALVFFGLVALGLFRHAGLLRYPATPEDGPTPLFDRKPLLGVSRSARLAELSRVAAERRAEFERPMSPAMEARARSFSPLRQLTLKQRQRMGTIAFGLAFVAQITLAIIVGGLPALLWPALGLAGVNAILTYHSAEVILKTEDKLSQLLKVAGILVALTALGFAVDTPPALWLAKIAALDLTAMIVGGLLPTAAYALSKRR